MKTQKPKLDDPATIKYVEKIFSSMPCSNRVSAAEKAAFDRCLGKDYERLRRKHLRIAAKLRREP